MEQITGGELEFILTKPDLGTTESSLNDHNHEHEENEITQERSKVVAVVTESTRVNAMVTLSEDNYQDYNFFHENSGKYIGE